MSSSTLSSQPDSAPKRSPTEALWAQLLRRDRPDPLSRNSEIPLPPAAPLDRNATSSRILLYDTQARLEQFSTRADGMLKAMHDATQQLKTVGMLFEKDRDTLTNDMIDLVNRSQTEIQKSAGRPAQQDQALAFQEKLELRIESLNQRLDALQMFNQTHSQAIETQSHTLKSIQEQQNALLSAVLPLLPLIQTVQPEIGSLKSRIQEVAANVSSDLSTFQKDLHELARTSERKRPFSIHAAGDSPLQRHASKRFRTDAPVSSTTTSESIPNSEITRRRSFFASPRPGHQVIQTPYTSTQDVSRVESLRLSPFPPRMASSSTTPAREQQHIASPRAPDVPISTKNIEYSHIDSTISENVSLAKTAPASLSANSAPAVEKIYNKTTSHSHGQNNIEAQKSEVRCTSPSSAGSAIQPLYPQHLAPRHPPSAERANEILSTIAGMKRTVLVPESNNSLARQHGVGFGLDRRMTMSIMPGKDLRGGQSPPRGGRRFIPLDDDDDDDDECLW